MTLVIFAGGSGTRMGNYTINCPKPLICIGNKPIIEHLIKYYNHFNVSNIIVCCGYLYEKVFEYYINKGKTAQWLNKNVVCINVEKNRNMTLINTGLNSGTAERLLMCKDYIKGDDFYLTYADGLSDIDQNKLLAYHQSNKKLVTISAVHPIEKYGCIVFDNNNQVIDFSEKALDTNRWINGGFMVVNKKVFNYYKTNDISFEKDILERLSKIGELLALKHNGFWFCMDSHEDMIKLEKMASQNNMPWNL